MARLFPLVVVAAIVVPTTVIGGTTAWAAGAYSPVQVVRAFAASGIELTPTHVYAHGAPARVELTGLVAPGVTLDVAVLRPEPGVTGGATVQLVATGSSASYLGSGFRGNVTVGWSTSGPCRGQVRIVREALSRLHSQGRHSPTFVFCHKLPLP